jgi:integrase
MATVERTKNGWRCQVYVDGKRPSKTFRTKREADAWGSTKEIELRTQKTMLPGEKFAFYEAMDRYMEEVSTTKRGERWERIRITALKVDPLLRCNEPISHIKTTHLVDWRNARLKVVKPNTVLREITLLSDIFETARKEWHWIEVNPIRDMSKPSKGKSREVVITAKQIRLMLQTMNYSSGQSVRTMTHAVANCFLLALRTGMRAGELCNLTWTNVHDGWCHLPITKTVSRDVPITPKAKVIIERMRGWDSQSVFGLKAQTLDALFRKYRNKAELEGFTFHDSRHTAATWIVGNMHSNSVPAQQAVFDLCKMFGWKNTDQALVYYNPHARDIAKRIG